jgi:hypothetical protein
MKPKEGRDLKGRREETRKNKTRKVQDKTRECSRSIGKERMSEGWEWRTNGQK